MSNKILDAALRYIARDWAVLPLHSINGLGQCTCENPVCGSAGKHPRTAHGVRDATKDPTVVKQWWSQWPSANVGIATGKVSGIIVLDVDRRHGGMESLTKAETQYGPMPLTPTVITGNGLLLRPLDHP